MKANDNVSPAAVKELPHMITDVLDTKDFGFRLEPTGNANNPRKGNAGDLVSR